MISVKGTIKNSVALLEPVKETDEGRKVIITFIDEEAAEIEWPNGKNGNVSLKSLIDEFQVDTGIEDLASQHDHYLYGTPKKGHHPSLFFRVSPCNPWLGKNANHRKH